MSYCFWLICLTNDEGYLNVVFIRFCVNSQADDLLVFFKMFSDPSALISVVPIPCHIAESLLHVRNEFESLTPSIFSFHFDCTNLLFRVDFHCLEFLAVIHTVFTLEHRCLVTIGEDELDSSQINIIILVLEPNCQELHRLGNHFHCLTLGPLLLVDIVRSWDKLQMLHDVFRYIL